MSTARGRDGGRTQSGGVKGVIAPDAGPAEPDDPDGDDFWRIIECHAFFLAVLFRFPLLACIVKNKFS